LTEYKGGSFLRNFEISSGRAEYLKTYFLISELFASKSTSVNPKPIATAAFLPYPTISLEATLT